MTMRRRNLTGRPDCAADPLAAQSIADPYPALERLRAETPVAWHERGMWIVTPHADVAALLRDPRFEHWQGRGDGEFGHAVNQLGGGTARMALAARFAVIGRAKLFRDVADRAQDLLGRLAARETFDLMRDFAHPLTFATSAQLCGVPEESIEHLTEITGILDGDVFAALSPDTAPQPKRGAAEALLVHLRAVLATAEERSAIGLVRELCGTGGIGIAALLLVLYAGHRNMMNAIGNSVLALLEHPAELERVRATPAILQQGVHELLRYDSPLQYVALHARQPVVVRDQRIERGEQVFLAIGAANRDPAVFAAPHELRLRRHPNDYLSFGSRMSGCPGRLPALVEIEAALAALFATFRHLRVVEPAIWRGEPIVQRGPASLIVGDLARA